MKKVISISLSILISTYFVGCSRRGVPKPNVCTKGSYCYKNINFGKSRGPSYEKGIRDGCRTGEGFFTKDYYKSSTDKNYYDGWILGRSKCKQILPNEGTILAEEKSKKRAEYQIRMLKMQKEQEPQQEESIVDAILNSDNSNNSDYEELEY